MVRDGEVAVSPDINSALNMKPFKVTQHRAKADGKMCVFVYVCECLSVYFCVCVSKCVVCVNV